MSLSNPRKTQRNQSSKHDNSPSKPNYAYTNFTRFIYTKLATLPSRKISGLYTGKHTSYGPYGTPYICYLSTISPEAFQSVPPASQSALSRPRSTPKWGHFEDR